MLRLEERGLKLIYCPEAVCTHIKPLDSVEKVISSGKKYGLTLAEWYEKIPHFQKKITSLGGRFNGGLNQLVHHPLNYFKDTFRRWAINKYTAKLIISIASKMPVINPPNKILIRFCKEIWAYSYRFEFKKRRSQLNRKKNSVFE